jgi:hypothetical protein
MMPGHSAFPKLTESRLTTHRYLTENKNMRHPSSSHTVNMRNNKKKKKCYAFHPSSLMMPGYSAYSKLTKIRLNTHRYLTENELMRHSSSSHIVNILQKKRNKRCYAFHPSSLMMPGNSAHSKLTESRLTTHRYLTEN